MIITAEEQQQIAKYLILKMERHQVMGNADSPRSNSLTRAKKCALDCIDMIIDAVGPMDKHWKNVKKCVADYEVKI